jgi:hypothetical protein
MVLVLVVLNQLRGGFRIGWKEWFLAVDSWVLRRVFRGGFGNPEN